MKQIVGSTSESLWPHRLAVLLVCATFPLLWIGGLVTSYDAGMAVPDWPNTYGYNLFLYPWQTWVFGPWNVFIEHGHRLIAASVGMITIVLLVVLLRREPRRWVQAIGVAALAAVIFQGVLGGMRVQMNAVLLAKIHGCFGPAFFSLAVALMIVTSRRWRAATIGGASTKRQDRRSLNLTASAMPTVESPHALGTQVLATVTTALAYLQLILGAQLRHLPAGAEPGFFRAVLLLHLFVAIALVGHAATIMLRTSRFHRSEAPLRNSSRLLMALMVVQMGLGAAAYVTNYGFPAWLSETTLFANSEMAGYTVQAKSLAQAHLTTAHVACGSLILVTCLTHAMWAWRLLRGSARLPAQDMLLGAAG